MRTRAVLSSIFTSLGILVVGAQLGSAAASSLTATGSAPGTGTTGTSGGTTGTGTTGTGTTTGQASSAKDGSFTGSSIGTFFGDVQVSVTISGGKISDVKALQLTNADGRSVQISNRAAPILRSEVLKSQSANVSNVSGATYTTQGYLSSLQSALDQAGFTG